MWKLNKIVVKDFLSYKHVEYSFEKGKTMLVQGINSDDEGQESNGSGKSVIIEALRVAISGDSFRDITLSELIREDQNEAELFLSMDNAFTEEQLNIQRKIYPKKSSELNVWINGVSKKFESVNSGNKLILETIGLSKEDLYNYFIITKDQYNSFFRIGDVKKKEIIARFANITFEQGIKEQVLTKTIDFDNRLREKLNEKANNNGKISVYAEQINNLKDPDILKNESVQKIEYQIEQLTSKNLKDQDQIDKWQQGLISREQKWQNLTSQLTEQKGQLNDLMTKSNVNFDEQLKAIEFREKEYKSNKERSFNKQKEFNESIVEFQEFEQELKKLLAGAITCPKCSHEFNLSEPEVDIEEAKLQSVEIGKEIKDAKEQINLINDQIKKINEKLSGFDKERDTFRQKVELFKKAEQKIKQLIRETETQIHTLNTEVRSIKLSADAYKTSIESNNGLIKGYKIQIEEVNNSLFEDKKPELQIKINELHNINNNADQQITDLEQGKQKIQEWLFVFNKFKTYLSNKCIKSIESFTNFYLEKIHTNLLIQIEGYKLLKNGKLSENITTDVLRNGMIAGKYGRFSNGERTRIDICNVLALQKLINLNSNTGGLDLLFMDEIAESLDSLGIENIVGSLNELSNTIYLITHTNHRQTYENVLTVKKQNGISQIQN